MYKWCCIVLTPTLHTTSYNVEPGIHYVVAYDFPSLMICPWLPESHYSILGHRAHRAHFFITSLPTLVELDIRSNPSWISTFKQYSKRVILVFLLFIRYFRFVWSQTINLNYSLRLESLKLESGGKTVWAKLCISYFTPLAGHLVSCHITLWPGFTVTALHVGSTWQPVPKPTLGPTSRAQAAWTQCHI